MQQPRWEISSLQAAMLVAVVVSLTGHALAVTFFVRAGGRDAWMSGLLALPLALLSMWSQVRLSQIHPGKTIIQYLPQVLGWAGYPLAMTYLLYYAATLIFTMRMTTDWLVDSILMQTPSWVMGAMFLAVVAYAANLGLDAVARIGQFTLPLLSVLGLLVAFGTAHAKDYGQLRPFLEHGLGPVFAATYLGLGYFGETSILAMFTGYVRPKDHKKLVKAYSLALLFVALTLTGPLAGSVATLGHRVAANMPYPTFTHWMLVSLARFFERTDLLAVHQWLAGAFVRCALFLLMLVAGGLQLTRWKARLGPVLIGAALVVLVLAEVLFRDRFAFSWFIEQLYLPAGAWLGIFAPPMLLAVALIRGQHRPGKGSISRGL